MQKGEWIFILIKNKLKYYTKEIFRYFNITIIALGLIIAIILIKYKPTYKVSISGKEVGYVQNKEAFEESIKESIINNETKNVDAVDFKAVPEYELKLVDKELKTNEEEIAKNVVQEDIIITYKYYEIALNDKIIDSVNTIEEAEEVINTVKEENEEELNLNVIEKYTNNSDEINTSEIEIAKVDAIEKVSEEIEEEKKQKEEEERINNMPSINGIKLAVLPITGTISSRYGVSSSIRSSTHTGLDIAAPQGTAIKAVAEGTVTCASYNGSYGNLVKIDHGNGIETWYGHTSKMYVTVGQKVEAGEVIAAVGSTGNSTGPHLHLEIRINGQHVNPQQYLYK